MKYTKWKDIAELVGIAAIVGSLIFVGMELRQQQRMAENEVSFNLVETRRAVRSAIVENADIWLRGNEGQALDPEETTIYEMLIRMYWSGQFWAATTRRGVGRELDVSIHDFAAFLHQNPGARRMWENVMDIEQDYRQQLMSEPVGVEAMNVVLADLRKLNI